MNIRDIQTMYDYNYWANHKILAATAHVTPEQFETATSHSYGSLRGTLVHILDAERSWRMLCQHNILAQFDELSEKDFPTIAVMQEYWREEEKAMREYLAQLTDEDMTGYVRYTVDTGQKRERLLWHCLYHLVNHGTQHRSEAAAILTGYGHSPEELDFTVFLNEQR